MIVKPAIIRRVSYVIELARKSDSTIVPKHNVYVYELSPVNME